VSELEVRDLLNVVQDALRSSDTPAPIEVLSAQPHWVELLVLCHRDGAEHVHQVVARLSADFPEDVLDSVGSAFRELVMNAVEWGGRLDPKRKVRIARVRTHQKVMARIARPRLA